MTSAALIIPKRIEVLLLNPELRAAPLRECDVNFSASLHVFGKGVNREARWCIYLNVTPHDETIAASSYWMPDFDAAERFLSAGEIDPRALVYDFDDDGEMVRRDARRESAQAGEGSHE